MPDDCTTTDLSEKHLFANAKTGCAGEASRRELPNSFDLTNRPSCTYNFSMEDISPACRIANECLAGRLRALNRVVTGICDDALRPYKVRISQMSVLVAIAALGQVRAADVCRRLKLDKSTLSRDLDRLLARKLVSATPAGGRTRHLEATDAGRALIAKVMPAWEIAQERVREVLGAALAKSICDAAARLQATDADKS
jgi:DNA-binding MarR family transcriptional regulator